MSHQRRRSSAGFIFGCLALAAATPLAVCAPYQSEDAERLERFGKRSDIYERSAPDMYVKVNGFWQNKHNRVINPPPQKRAKSSTSHVSNHSRRSEERIRKARAGACLDSTYTEDDINWLLWSTGDNAVVQLCPGAVITTQGPIMFNSVNQELSTQGYPTTNKAKLVIGGANQDTMVYGNCDTCSGCSIKNIEIDGQRPTLGYMSNGAALVEMGGGTHGQVFDQVYFHDPRGWSAFHVIEGNGWTCTGASITNSVFGPSGIAPNTAAQFRKRNFNELVPASGTGLSRRATQPAAQWADGISLACANSYVAGNTIQGATDGAIVLFGSPNSVITGNTIVSTGNTLMGGVNLVDHGPWNGAYQSTQVTGNTFIARDAMMKVGVAMGLMVWGGYNDSSFRTSGGVVTNNKFLSNGGEGYFAYGIANAGHDNAAWAGNDFSGALFGGTPSPACVYGWTPNPQASVYDQYATSGASPQLGITNSATCGFMICMMPCSYSSSGCAFPPAGPVYVTGFNSTTSMNTTIPINTTLSAWPTTITSASSAAPTATSTLVATNSSSIAASSTLSSSSSSSLSSSVVANVSSTAAPSSSSVASASATNSSSSIVSSTSVSSNASSSAATSSAVSSSQASSSVATSASLATITSTSSQVSSNSHSATSSSLSQSKSSSSPSPVSAKPSTILSSSVRSSTASSTARSTATITSKSSTSSKKSTSTPSRKTSTSIKISSSTSKPTSTKFGLGSKPNVLQGLPTLPSGMWYSSDASRTIVISTQTASGRCGAAFGTRTVCETPAASCVAAKGGISTCSPTPTVTAATTGTGVWVSTDASRTVTITTASVNSRCGAAFGTRTVCATPSASCVKAGSISTCSPAAMALAIATTITSGGSRYVLSPATSTVISTVKVNGKNQVTTNLVPYTSTQKLPLPALVAATSSSQATPVASSTSTPATSTKPTITSVAFVTTGTGVWVSNDASRTVTITTASVNSRCGAAFGTRTVCASPSAYCVKAGAISTCSPALTAATTMTSGGSLVILSPTTSTSFSTTTSSGIRETFTSLVPLTITVKKPLPALAATATTISTATSKAATATATASASSRPVLMIREIPQPNRTDRRSVVDLLGDATIPETPELTFEEQKGFDKRMVLADDEYWSSL